AATGCRGRWERDPSGPDRRSPAGRGQVGAVLPHRLAIAASGSLATATPLHLSGVCSIQLLPPPPIVVMDRVPCVSPSRSSLLFASNHAFMARSANSDC